MWDLPGPGIKPVSPALADRFFTTAPPGKPFHPSLSVLIPTSVPHMFTAQRLWRLRDAPDMATASRQYTENSCKKEENNKITITPTAQPTSTPKPIQANQKAGDVNGDGAVTVMDLLKVRKAILGMNQLTEEEQKAADINGNGKIDVLDLLRIQKSILGIE